MKPRNLLLAAGLPLLALAVVALARPDVPLSPGAGAVLSGLVERSRCGAI